MLFYCLAGPMTAVARTGGEPATVYFYRGEINQENNRRLLESVSGRTIRRLVIDSPGGEVRAGIELGLWIFRRGIDVEVANQCLSSCANYVFPAGRHKIIRRGAVVAWHGNYHHLQATSLWSDDIEARMTRTGEDRETATDRVRQRVRELVRREEEFFRRIGVDQRLCWVGKMPPYSVPNYYTLGVGDMQRYGLHSIITEGDYEDTDLDRFDVDIRWINLEDL